MPTKTGNALAKRIKTTRRQRGISQEELAQRLKMDPGSVSRMERGLRPISKQTARRLARALGEDPNEFVALFFTDKLAPSERKSVHRFLDQALKLAR